MRTPIRTRSRAITFLLVALSAFTLHAQQPVPIDSALHGNRISAHLSWMEILVMVIGLVLVVVLYNRFFKHKAN